MISTFKHLKNFYLNFYYNYDLRYTLTGELHLM